MQVGNTISTPALAQMLQAQAGPGGTQAMSGAEGGFAMVLQQMLQLGEGMDVLGGLLAQFQQTQEDSEEQGTDLAAMMMAELMSGGSMLLPVDPVLVQGGETAAVAVGNSVPQQQMLFELLKGQPAEETLTPEQMKQFVQALGEQQDTVSAETGTKTQTSLFGSLQTEGDAEPAVLLGQNGFLSSVAEAKKLLQAQSGEKKQEPFVVDVEQLQRQVDTGRYNATPVKTAGQDLNANEVLEQVKTGLKTQLAQGKSAFEISIKPEGLGKITVKLVEAGDKVTLNLIASTPNVAKLLNNSLADLQAAMRPYHVEVQEAVSQSQNAQQSNIYGQAFADQQQKQQQYEEQGRHAQNRRFSDSGDEFDQAFMDEVPGAEQKRYI